MAFELNVPKKKSEMRSQKQTLMKTAELKP